MQCHSCGAEVKPTASHCPSCGAGAPAAIRGGRGSSAALLPIDAIDETRADDAVTVAHHGARFAADSATTLGDAPTVAGDATRIAAPIRTTGANTFDPDVTHLGDEEMTQTPDLSGAASSRHAPTRVSAGPLHDGQAFGPRYQILRALGVGGMGAVYQAWDAELGVAVAIKVIRPEVMADPAVAANVQRRFKRELLLARQVTHKNVVRIHDLGEIDGIKYITMTYVDGADLASRLKREGRMDVPAVMHIARDVVSGLLAAHKAGVVHRDLKPANIVIDSTGDALIMDFGIARSSGGSTRSNTRGGASPLMPGPDGDPAATTMGTVVGTVEYMAPEQARGGEVDQRADIYALGLMLYDMLIGREHRAQRTQSAIAELQLRMTEPPPRAKSVVPEIPEALDQLIARCLEPDPEKRYQTTEELGADLARLDDNGARIPLPRRFTARTMAAGTVAIALLVGGTWWLTRTPPPEKPHEPISVVIADFQNGTTDPALGDSLAQTTRRGLEGATFISAYDRSNMRSIGVRPAAKLDPAAARELALKQGFGVVLGGSIQPKGSGYDIEVTASETVTGKVITASSGYAGGTDQVLPTATRLVARVRKALGDPTSESAQLFAMRSISASSPDVVKYYVAALEAQAQAKMEDAHQSYLKSVELDPNFGLGYQGLAVTSYNLGRRQEADKYIQEALRHLDTMTDRERFATRGYYDKLIGDNAQCVKEYGDLLARYPADAIAHNGRAGCYYNLRDMSSAAKELREAIVTLPNHAGLKTNLALITALAGDFEAAEQQTKALPQTPFTLQVLAYTQLGRGLLPQADATYRTIAATGPAGASSAAIGLGDLAVYQGRFAEAVRILEQGATADLAAKNANRAAIKLTSAAYAHLLAGRPAQAAATADRALSNSTSMAVRFLAARIFAESGAVEKARALAAALASELPTQPRAYGKIVEGLIALNSGQRRDAVRLLDEANAMLDTWFGRFDLGRAYLAASALPQADAEFERCIARRGEALTLMDEGPTFGYFPAVFYYQGRVRQGLNTASFADAYRKYLEIRGASTEDPLVLDARKRTAR